MSTEGNKAIVRARINDEMISGNRLELGVISEPQQVPA